MEVNGETDGGLHRRARSQEELQIIGNCNQGIDAVLYDDRNEQQTPTNKTDREHLLTIERAEQVYTPGIEALRPLTPSK